MNQSMIFGYENVTHYLRFAENPIRFNPVVTKKCEFLYRMSRVHFVQVLTNCRLTMHRMNSSFF